MGGVNSKVSDWFKKVWAQIKEAFEKLGEKIKISNAKIKAWFDKVGAQIKEAFDNLGKKIKETAEKVFPPEFRAKIAAMAKKYAKIIEEEVEAAVKKYEDLIVDALTKDGKVIVEEAKKLLITTIE